MTRTPQATRNRERGMAIILSALMMFFLIPMVGLAIDVGVLYMLRNKMSAASDAAALGAARGLNVQGTATEQRTAAENSAGAFFSANFPDGLLGTKNRVLTTTFTPNDAILTVSVKSVVKAPTFFMRALGFTDITVSGYGQATRRNTNLVLLLDKSGSMGSACSAMRDGAELFVNYMSKEFDVLGLITYGDNAYDDYRPDKNWATGNALVNKIKSISCGGNTASIPAMQMGYEQLKKMNQPLARNVLMFFTDGLPNNLPAYFPVMTQANDRLGVDSGYTWNGATKCSGTGTVCTMDPIGTTNNPSVVTCTNAGHRYIGMIAQHAGGEWTGNTIIRNIGMTYTASTNSYTSINQSVDSSCSISNQNQMRRAVAFIPPTDYFGNKIYGMTTSDGTATGAPTNWNSAIKGYDMFRENHYLADGKTWVKNKDTYNHYFDAGHPYEYRLRPDRPSVVYGGGIQALDDLALTVRKNSLAITIFSVGYSANGGVDREALARIANDPDAYHSGTKLDTLAADDKNGATPTNAGLYIEANDAVELRQAFAMIASSVLRLSQ